MSRQADSRRYPGAHSFQDSPLDRELFFGRSQEAKNLLDTILSETLVILYARSGVGKTSLLNAGVKQPLRDQNFLPVVARLHDVTVGPLRSVMDSIAQSAKEQGIEHRPGSEESLWLYFKTAEFWRGDALLTPVLILDQFEELFTLQGVSARQQFIEQLSELVRGRKPDLERAHTETSGLVLSDSPPQIKIVIAIREDYLTSLEELTTLIPGILRTRFRLLALNREEARLAIEDPAHVRLDRLATPPFQFAPGTVDSLLDLLVARSQVARSGTEAIEPFHLQLMCQQVEDLVRRRVAGLLDSSLTRVQISFEDLGGKEGLHRVIRDFYERQLTEVGRRFNRRKIERLCERGLVNSLGKRLSAEENEISRRYGVRPAALAALALSRVLRSEPKLDSTFYELSHDLLVEPVLSARVERRRRRTRIQLSAAGAVVMISMSWLLWSMSHERTRRDLIQSVGRVKELASSDSEKGLMAAVAATGRSLDFGEIPEVSRALSFVLAQRNVTTAPFGTKAVLAAAVAPGGRLTAVVTQEGVLELRDRGGRLIQTLGRGRGSDRTVLTFSRDGDALAAATGTRLEAWDVAGRPLTTEIRLPEPVTALAFNPVGDLLVAATNAKKMCGVDLDRKSMECAAIERLDGNLSQILFPGSDDRLAGLSTEGSLYGWQTLRHPDQNMTGPIKPSLNIRAEVQSQDGRFSAAIYGRSILLWQASAQTKQVVLKGSDDLPVALAFSPEGDKLAVVMNDGKLFVVRTVNGQNEIVDAAKVGKISSIAWGKDGLLAVGGSSGLSFLWGTMSSQRTCVEDPSESAESDVHAASGLSVSGEAKPNLRTYTASVKALAFLSDGSLLTSDRAGVRLWGKSGSLCASEERPRYELESESVSDLAAIPGRPNFLAITVGGDMQVWSVDRSSLAHGRSVDLGALSSAHVHVNTVGTMAEVIGGDGQSQTFRISGDELSEVGGANSHAQRIAERVNAIESDQSGAVFAGTNFGTVYSYNESWDAKDNKVGDAPVKSLKFARTVGVLATIGAEGNADLWPINDLSFESKTSIRVHTEDLLDMAISPDGTELVLADGARGILRAILNWPKRLAVGDQISVAPHQEFIVALNVDAHSLQIIDKQVQRTLAIYENVDNRCAPSSFAIAPDGRTILVGCQEGRLVLLAENQSLPAPRTMFNDKGDSSERESVVSTYFSHLFFVAGSSRGRLAMWKPNGDELQAPWHIGALDDGSSSENDRVSAVTAVLISSDGNLVVAGTADGWLSAWQITGDGRQHRELWVKGPLGEGGIASLAFAPGEREVLAGFNKGAVHQYSARNGTLSNFLIHLDLNEGQNLVKVAVSPDGKRILTASNNGRVQLWSLTGEPVTEPIEASDAAFTPDGSMVTSGPILTGPVLPASLEQWLADGCARLRYSKGLEGSEAQAVCIKRVWKREGSGDSLIAASDDPAFATKNWFGLWLTGRLREAENDALHLAVRGGRLSALVVLLQRGADPNSRDGQGRTSLSVALRSGLADAAAILLAHGADPKALDRMGNTLLHDAVAGGLPRAALRLLDLGAAIDSGDQDGVTPLMIAAARGDQVMTSLLLDHHARIDVADHMGRTALIDASRANSPDVVRLLVDRRADPNKTDNGGFYGVTALNWVRKESEVAAILARAKPLIQEPPPDMMIRIDLRILPQELMWTVQPLLDCQSGNNERQIQMIPSLRDLAAKGSGGADFVLGLAYTSGCGVPVDPFVARQHFQLAMEKGSYSGEAAFGVCLRMGYGGSHDATEALTRIRDSAAHGDPFGLWLQVQFGNIEQFKIPAEKVKALKAVTNFAPAANSAALFDYDSQIESELSTEQRGLIQNQLQAAADAGDIQGVSNLGMWLAEARRDFPAAIDLWRKAMTMKTRMFYWPGLTRLPASYPAFFLGRAYEFGLGTRQSDTEALRWYKNSGAGNNSSACLYLARMYDRGYGTPASMKNAVSYYRQASATGSSYASQILKSLNYLP